MYYYYISTDKYGKVSLIIGTKEQFVNKYGEGHRHHLSDDSIFDFVKEKLKLKLLEELQKCLEEIAYFLDI